MTRRRWLTGGALGLLLAGCGFELRHPPELPYRRVAFKGFASRSPMAEALRQALPPGTAVVDSPAQAEVVLNAREDRTYRVVAASTTAGQVREFRLRVQLKFEVTRPGGELLLAETELERERDMSYTETAALAKQDEEIALLREMRGDLAQQVMRMLASVARTPRPAAAPVRAVTP